MIIVLKTLIILIYIKNGLIIVKYKRKWTDKNISPDLNYIIL